MLSGKFAYDGLGPSVGFGDTGFGGGRVEQLVFRVHDQRSFAGSGLEADVGDEF